MKEENGSLILGVIEHDYQGFSERNYLLHPQALMKLIPVSDPLHRISSHKYDNEVQEYMFSSTKDGPIRQCSVLTISLDNPVRAAAQLSKFVDGKWNQASFSVTLDCCSSEAVQELAFLLKSYDQGKHCPDMRPNSDYIENILTKLGLLWMKRRRPSITQSSVSVKILGHSVVNFGDELWLRRADGSVTDGGRILDDAPMYGEIIDGWGSITPDTEFLKAAITKYPDRIAHELENYGQNKFLEMIRSVSQHSDEQAQVQPLSRGYVSQCPDC